VEVRRKPIFLSTKKKTACVADLSQSKAKQVVHSEPLNIKAKSPDLTLSNRVVVILFPLSFILRYEGWRWASTSWRDNFKVKMASTSWRDNFLVNLDKENKSDLMSY
jgi:hypothetical protein